MSLFGPSLEVYPYLYNSRPTNTTDPMQVVNLGKNNPEMKNVGNVQERCSTLF